MKHYDIQIKSVFGEELAKLRRVKNLTLEKVAALTKIQIRYLERLEKGEFAKLPADVYAKGMIVKYAKAIDADPEELWQRFEEERKTAGPEAAEGGKTAKSSGFWDRLPQNRFLNASFFVLTPRLITIISLAVILILIFGYFIYQLDYLVGPPTLVVFEPATDVLTEKKVIDLKGRVEAGAILTINGRQAGLDDQGRFEEKMEIQPGVNVIEFSAKNHLGKVAIVKRMIVLSATSSPAFTPELFPELPATSSNQ